MTNVASFANGAVHVVAGVLSDAEGRVLVAQRPAGSHLAGTWEFPGGKIEPGESAEGALRRELREELGIDIDAAEALISVPWRYPRKAIVLHAFRVTGFGGEPHAREHTALRWLPPGDAVGIEMPPPDRPILNALRLPRAYAITPEPGTDPEPFLARLRALLAPGARMLQLRARHLAGEPLRRLAASARDLARGAGATLLINRDVQLARELGLDGVHLPAADLMRLEQRPLERGRWVAASCHDRDELDRAAAIDADFAVLGPVLPTASHPGAAPLGWERFRALVEDAPLPVFALGGLRPAHLDEAHRAGAQGIAGISAFWPDE